MKKDKKEKKDSSEIKWFITIFITAFILSIIFSFISTTAIEGLPIVPAIFVLLLVIFIGIMFDVIGVAVMVGKESDFNAMAAKKIPGAKTSLNMIKNSEKVSNICADVVGDVAGVLSGSIAALIAFNITNDLGLGFNVQFIISAIVASLTIGGKAIGKGIAQKNSTKIVGFAGRVVKIFKKEK